MNEASANCYRPRPYYLMVGVVCTVVFAAFGVSSTIAALWNVDGSFPRPMMAAAIFAVLWSCFVLLGLWLVLLSIRGRLYISAENITDVGCVFTSHILVADVVRIVWRTVPRGGSVLVYSAKRRLKIEFSSFTERERRELISFLRNTFPHGIQERWDEFDGRYLNPRPLSRSQRLRIRVINAILLTLLGAFGFFYTSLGLFGRGAEFLLLGLMNLLAAVVYLWLWRRSERTRAAEPQPK